jgi:hypothetical protein
VPLFDDKERTDDSPKRRNESAFAFYDRASGRPFAAFRDLANQWTTELPIDTRAEVVSRMRNGNDLGFGTGLAETMLHAALTRLGFRLVLHPEVPGTTNRLDFLVGRENGERVAYLEITTMNPPAAEVARDNREAVLFEALNSAAIPDDLWLTYEVAAYGSASPSRNRLQREVENWAHERADAARAADRVERVFAIDDWRFRLALIGGFRSRAGGRRIALSGAMHGRIVGAPPSIDGLARALDAKARRYGELDLPYVIAVFDRTDSLAWFSSDFAGKVAEALFGSEGITLLRDPSGETRSREQRARNGWFGHPGALRRRGVSAVLVFPSAQPWSLADRRGQPLLVRNPWATRRLPDGILPVQELVLDEREGRVVPDRMMSELLGLPDPWPAED